jgi:hypothetical protein
VLRATRSAQEHLNDSGPNLVTDATHSLRKQALNAHPPAKELVPPGWSPGNPRKLAFVTEKQPTLIAIGWERSSSQAGLAPAEAQRLSRRTFSPVTQRIIITPLVTAL